MQSMYEDIKEFHRKFELEYKGPPRHLPEELEHFRAKFMGEELAEYLSSDSTDHGFVLRVIEAIRSFLQEPQPLEKKLDALVDLVYVALGTSYLHGFDFDEAWRRVHEANMSKVRALREEDSKRGSVYDVVKPPGWTAPDLSDLV